MVWSNRFSPAPVVVTVILALIGGPGACADDAARRVIEDFHARLVQLAAEGPQDLDARVAALEPLIVESHDLAYIARLTLRRQWPDLAEAERQTFIRAFTDLSVMTYATRFQAVTADTFTIDGVRDVSRGRVQVEAAINRPDGAAIPLTYLLHATSDGWRIINIIADGVSDLALKRAEYQQILQEDSFAGLVAHLGQLTDALRDGDS